MRPDRRLTTATFVSFGPTPLGGGRERADARGWTRVPHDGVLLRTSVLAIATGLALVAVGTLHPIVAGVPVLGGGICLAAHKHRGVTKAE
jgi:hypothetical protein